MKKEDQRQEYRLRTQLAVFLELPGATPATIMVSQTLDISANGLCVIIDRDLPVGCILRSGIQLANSPQRLMLITEVKWSLAWQGNGEFLLGLALFESEESDIQAWKEFIASQFDDA